MGIIKHSSETGSSCYLLILSVQCEQVGFRGDLMDNDCDGYIDEEIVDGVGKIIYVCHWVLCCY